MPAYLNSIIADAKPRSTPAANRASVHTGLPGVVASATPVGGAGEKPAAQVLHKEPNPVKINQPQQESAGRHQSSKTKPVSTHLVMQPESEPDKVVEELPRINEQSVENAISRPLSGTKPAGTLSEQNETPYRNIDTRARDKQEGPTPAEPAGSNTRAVQTKAGVKKQASPQSVTIKTENNIPHNPAAVPVQKEPQPALSAQQADQVQSSIPEQQRPPGPETTPPDSVISETSSNQAADTSVAGLTVFSPQAAVEAEKEKMTPVVEPGGADPETAAAEVIAPVYALPYTQPQGLVNEKKGAGAQEIAAAVHIGQIDIIVQTDSKPAVPRQTEQRGTPDLSSRYYLRRLL